MRDRKFGDVLDKILGKKLERRGYQLWLLAVVARAKNENKNAIVELDAGMGKRIISYLICRMMSNENILIITPSRASVWDMALTFKELSGNDDWFGVISGGMHKWLKLRNLSEKRVIITTPISLLRVLEKNPNVARRFGIVIINEVDKIVRRIPHIVRNMNRCLEEEKRGGVLVYPWSHLRKYLAENACWVGMSGTLRDEHIILEKNGLRIRSELETVAEIFFPKKPLIIVTMDQLIEKTDAKSFIIKNLTIIRPVGIKDSNVKVLVDSITSEIEEVIDKIREYYSKLYPPEDTPMKQREKIQRAISLLSPTNPLKIKFLKLALARRHIFASPPRVYVKFLSKPMFRRIVQKYSEKSLEDIIPQKSSKIESISRICKEWISLKNNIIIVSSYVRTALYIRKVLEKTCPNANILLLTGRTYNKKRVIKDFKEKSPSILILTPVAERDLDFPEASLVIIHDIISTIKSMYQRIKRARRSMVMILYYADTYEEKKVNILLSRMIKKYPWSIRILWNK